MKRNYERVHTLEHKTCDILAAEQLRYLRSVNRLIIGSLKVVGCSRDSKGNTNIYLVIRSRKRKFCVVLSLVKEKLEYLQC